MVGCCKSREVIDDVENVAEMTETITKKAGGVKIADVVGSVSKAVNAVDGATNAFESFKNGDILEGAGHIANVTQTIAGIAGAEDVANVSNIVGDSANLAGKAVDIGGDAVKVAKHCCTVM
ncbi:uncharacterized protein LOC143043679 [Mytilus galloprovincialis]|uniref:uncharacterized protein LOC143043679 n=1 Tax=Mytilus galloprovincialis TaxID=29158 RepID=UPI003F7C7AC5